MFEYINQHVSCMLAYKSFETTSVKFLNGYQLVVEDMEDGSYLVHQRIGDRPVVGSGAEVESLDEVVYHAAKCAAQPNVLLGRVK